MGNLCKNLHNYNPCNYENVENIEDEVGIFIFISIFSMQTFILYYIKRRLNHKFPILQISVTKNFRLDN